MNQFNSFKEFLTAQGIQTPLWFFVASVLLTALFSFILTKLYVKFGRSLSNREQFAENFIPVSITTMLIISIVKSSLALSLGMVGALSIVRFRAAIKDPEELSYLFVALAIGIGFGASQPVLTTITFVVVSLILVLRGRRKTKDAGNLLYLILRGKSENTQLIEGLEKLLSENVKTYHFQRMDDYNGRLEVSFLISGGDLTDLKEIRKGIRKIDENAELSFTRQHDLA